MDYYQLQNIQADTAMRDSLGRTAKGATEEEPGGKPKK